MSAEAERYVALAANAHIDREYTPVGDTVPTIDELESLASRVERLNTEGSTTEFIDAQSEYIDALTVALEWQATDTVTTEYHDSIVNEAQRQIHALEAQLQAARVTIAELQAWEVAQRVDHSKHVHAEDSLVACPETSWKSVEARDVAAILNRAAKYRASEAKS